MTASAVLVLGEAGIVSHETGAAREEAATGATAPGVRERVAPAADGKQERWVGSLLLLLVLLL